MKSTARYLAYVLPLLFAVILLSCTASKAPRNNPNDIQAQLNALQVPQGADAAVFQQLKDELARQLAELGKKASTPPTGTANTPVNVHIVDDGGGAFSLHWEYRNLGDYDQNGTVAVADITPIAMHFGHAPGTDALDNVIDVDGNGVGVSDITPIAQNFGVNCAGYDIMESVNDIDPGSALYTLTLPELTSADSGNGWLEYSAVTSLSDTYWYYVVPFDGEGNRGQASDRIQFIAPVFPPVITDVQPQTGPSGLVYAPNMTFTGSGITSVHWDFGGGATPNTWDDLFPSPTLGAEGSYNASVTLTNDDGSDTFDFTLVVTAYVGVWNSYLLLGPPWAGEHFSVAIANGRPAIAYIKDSDGSINYLTTFRTDPPRTDYWQMWGIDFGGSRAYDGKISLTVDQYGYPVIVGRDTISGNAMFIAATTASPSSPSDWDISVIRAVDEVGSVALGNGNIGVTVKAADGLHYLEPTAYPPTGPSDWADVLVAPGSGTGVKSKLAYNIETDAFFAFYYNSDIQALFSTHCAFADRLNPAAWVTYQASQFAGDETGLYFDFAFDPTVGSQDMFFVHTTMGPGYLALYENLGQEDATNNGGFSFNSITSSGGEACALVFVGGNVLCAYRSGDMSQLIVNAAPYSTGSLPMMWFPSQVYDTSVEPISDIQMLIVGTNLVVVYSRTDGIHYAYLSTI